VRHPLFTASWVASLLFAVAVTGLWGGSYFTADTVFVSGGYVTVLVNSVAGSVWVASEIVRGPELPWEVSRIESEIPRNYKGRLSSLYRFDLDSNGGQRKRWDLVFPHWALLVPTLVLPVVALRRHLRRRGLAEGFSVEAPATPPFAGAGPRSSRGEAME
jgi:hypothetical protein